MNLSLFSTNRQRRRVALRAFDPALPEDHSLIVAGVLRDQFNGLKSLIDAVPVVQSATVEAVQTLPPSQPAAADVTLIGQQLRFTFAIPQGDQGATGSTGEQGPQGPPFAQAVVDGVTTLPAGSAATVGVYFDGTYVHFSFGISQGETGSVGPQGNQGPPGEVTTTQMDTAIANAIAGTSANSNAVQPVPFVAAESYDQSQAQAMIDKMNELIATLRR
jgi:hypothetical protein